MREETCRIGAELFRKFFALGNAVCVAIAAVAFEIEVGEQAPRNVSGYRRGVGDPLLRSASASESVPSVGVEFSGAAVVGVVAPGNKGKAVLPRKVVDSGIGFVSVVRPVSGEEIAK